MEKYKSELYLAEQYQELSHKYLNKSVQSALKGKGFKKETEELFSADFASGHETIVKFNMEGEFLEISVECLKEMTKEEIIKKLSNDLSDRSLELLIK